MSTHQRPTSPPAPSSRLERSGYHRDRGDRDRRRERDGEQHDQGRRERERYGSAGSSRRERDYDPKRNSRRSASPPPRSSRKPRDSRSKSPSRRRRSRSRSRSRSRRVDGDEDGDKAKDDDKDEDKDKGKPNFGSSGLLAAATKTVKTGEGKDVVLKYHEPPEARKPLLGWRLYVFKGNEQVGTRLWSLLSTPGTNKRLRRSTAYSQTERVSCWKGQSYCRYTIRPPVVLEAARSDSACVVNVRETFRHPHATSVRSIRPRKG